MWTDRLRNSYGSFAEFQAYSETYGLASRLGYVTASAAWKSNPIVQGGTSPNDFRKIRPSRLADAVRRHMARAFFASAWADQCEEMGHGMQLSGREITEIMPRSLDPAAVRAARDLARVMEGMNKMELPELYLSVAGKVTPEEFGHYSAMQAMGHGVGLSDYDITDAEVEVPYLEFSQCSLERDYFLPLPGYPKD